MVGDFKLEDRHIADPASNAALWREKRKYVTGTTRYVLFVTPRYLQLRDATGKEVALLHLPRETTDLLRQKLAPISWEKARHEEDWKALVEGRLPYAYLVLDPEGTRKLQEDLKVSFAEWACLKNRLVPRRWRQEGEETPEPMGNELQKGPHQGRVRIALPYIPPTQPVHLCPLTPRPRLVPHLPTPTHLRMKHELRHRLRCPSPSEPAAAKISPRRTNPLQHPRSQQGVGCVFRRHVSPQTISASASDSVVLGPG